ncbi:hypothetical protein ACU8KH_05862 [Lachancea thermotolerans]
MAFLVLTSEISTPFIIPTARRCDIGWQPNLVRDPKEGYNRSFEVISGKPQFMCSIGQPQQVGLPITETSTEDIRLPCLLGSCGHALSIRLGFAERCCLRSWSKVGCTSFPGY